MIRWNYLIPRLVLLLAAFVAFHFLKNPVTKWMLVKSATSANGASVEIESMSVSARSGQISITDLRCADPRVEGNNLFQFESGEFQLSLWQALRKTWIVESADIQGVRFGTPRTNAVHSATSGKQKNGYLPATPLSAGNGDSKHRVIADLERHMPMIIESGLESSRLIRELEQAWPRNMDAAGSDAAELAGMLERIEQELAERNSNPLRDLKQIASARQQTAMARDRLSEAQKRVQDLAQNYQRDRLALIEAQQKDLDSIAAMTANIRLDETTLNQLLLDEQSREVAGLTLEWAKWLRDHVISREIERNSRGLRGKDVVFHRHPEFVIRKLAVAGDTCISGKNMEFSGTICNLSSSPELLNAPVTFDIRGLDESNFHLTGTVDYRSGAPICEICLTCPSLELPARKIGKPDVIRLAVSPSQQSFIVRLKLSGDQIEGSIDVETARARLSVEQLADALNREKLRETLDSRLQSIGDYSMMVDIRGTPSEPVLTLNSDLGSRFSDLLGQTWQENIAEKGAARQRELENRFARQVADLDARFQNSAEKVARYLNQESARLANLSESLETAGSTVNSIR
jgi:uncharacterized protein (TIGR03545 family)